jgi:LmbE family N-acetylglucosaminyl deacetylase
MSNPSVRKILSYETLSESNWSLLNPHSFTPNIYVDISDTLEDKIRAMSVYKSELRPFPYPRSLEAIKILAQKRGIEAGLSAAEAFMLIRETIV